MDRSEDCLKVNQHVTEIRSCPVSVKVTIHSFVAGKTQKYEGEFNFFHSAAKELETLDFSLSSPIGIETGQAITLEYSFLAIRYLCRSKVMDIDNDFGLVSLSIPDCLMAITARRFDRKPCDLSVQITGQESAENVNGKLVEISASGGVAVWPAGVQQFPKVEAYISIRFPAHASVLKAKIKSINGMRVGFAFALENDDDRTNLKRNIESRLR